MTEDEIKQATAEIQNYIAAFDYATEYKKTQDKAFLVGLNRSSYINYEKLQIYWIIFNEISENSVVKKFVYEALTKYFN